MFKVIEANWIFCITYNYLSLLLIILLVGAITCKVVHVSFPNLLCMLLKSNSQTSSIMAIKKLINGRFIAIFDILRP